MGNFWVTHGALPRSYPTPGVGGQGVQKLPTLRPEGWITVARMLRPPEIQIGLRSAQKRLARKITMSRPILSQRHSSVTWLAPIAVNVNGHAPIAITVASRLHGLAPIAIQRTAAQLNPTHLNSTRNVSQPNSTQLNSPIRNSYHTSPQMRSAEVMISYKPLAALPKRPNRRPKRNGSSPQRVLPNPQGRGSRTFIRICRVAICGCPLVYYQVRFVFQGGGSFG